MPVGLARAAVLPAVEKGKQLLSVSVSVGVSVLCRPFSRAGVMVRADARVRRREVNRFEGMGLGLEGARDEDGVLGDDGEFVEDEGVGCADGCDG